MVSVNATFFVQLLQFIILVFIMNYLLFKPLMKVVRDRELKIQRTREEIAEIQRKIQALLDRKSEQEAQAIKSANKRREEMKLAGIQEALELQEKMKEEALKKKSMMEQEVKKAIELELLHIETISQKLAKELMAKLVLRSS